MYDTPQERLSTENAANIILNDAQENLLCEMQPTCADKNSVFIEKLMSPKDVTCDDMESWRLNGTHPSYVIKHPSGEISLVSQKSKKSKSKMKENMYKIIKRYYYHKTARDLNKTIFVIQGNKFNLFIISIFILHT